MAAYNGERFIVEAVESVLAQGFADFELIISDDGSTDGTVDLARSLADRDPQRIRLLTGHHNQGKPFALNRALAVRRGALIAWLDQDDVMLPGKLERQVRTLDASPAAAGCTHDAEIFDSPSGRTIGSFSAVMNGAPLRSGGVELWFDPTYKMLPSATMIRASASPPGGFDERLIYSSERLFDIEVFRHGRCVAIDDVLVRYRRHDDNFTNRGERSGLAYEEGLLTMEIVRERYPELARGARSISTAIHLGEARRCAAARDWHTAARNLARAYRSGGVRGAAAVAGAVARSAARRRAAGHSRR